MNTSVDVAFLSFQEWEENILTMISFEIKY